MQDLASRIRFPRLLVALCLIVGLLTLSGCASGPPRSLADSQINAWVESNRSPSDNILPGHNWKVSSFDIQRTQLSESGHEARVYGHLAAISYDNQWNPPAEHDISGMYYFVFAKDEYGKWQMSGGPYRQ
jgi:hypothetical protein